MNQGQQTKAQALLNLVGLQRHPAGSHKPTKRDKRWQQREEAWAVAEKSKALFEKVADREEVRNTVLNIAKGYGFFSVWMTVFDGHPDVKRELVQLFPGTALSCFNTI